MLKNKSIREAAKVMEMLIDRDGSTGTSGQTGENVRKSFPVWGLRIMKVEFRKADTADAELLIDIYNSSFYDDYMKYGECPAYGKTQEMMRQSIIDYSKFLILYNGRPVGCISCKEAEKGIYEVGCLCVIPEFQGKGIGTAAMEFAKSYYSDWKEFTLVTPADKRENIRFYTEKCGFDIRSVEMDGNVQVVRFVLER